VAVPHGHSLDDGEKRRHVHLGNLVGLDVRHATLQPVPVARASLDCIIPKGET
jgi:hypothetical protein